MENDKLVRPGQAHSAGGMVSDKLMEWGANRECVRKWMDDPNHPLWLELKRHVMPSKVLVKNLGNMIAAGQYSFVADAICERNFGPESLVTGEEAQAMSFYTPIPLEDMASAMNHENYKLGSLGDLLMFVIEHSHERRTYPIAALGSVPLMNRDLVVITDMGENGPRLLMVPRDEVWRRGCCILKVRKYGSMLLKL